MRITIETVEHTDQRYPTVGDWTVSKPDSLDIRVSKMGDPRHEFLVALHELIEATLCAQAGIKQSAVDAFDRLFEAERAQGAHPDEAEPGDDLRCPYFDQHLTATCIEMLMAKELNVDWREYEKAIAAL